MGYTKKMSKVIFLDIDGVLNNMNYIVNHPGDYWTIDLEKVKLLKQLVSKTNAEIVLISSRRYDPGITGFFRDNDLEVYDKVGKEENRSEAINIWLSEHPEVTNYIILDDETSEYTEEQMNHTIQTNECYSSEVRVNNPYFEGLQRKHVLWAIAMLS